MKKLFILILALAFSIPAMAQYKVSVELHDAATGEPVGFATVSLTRKGASTPAKYVLSNDIGKADIEKVSKGTYTFKAELMGYVSFEREVEIKANMDLGIVNLEQNSETLEAARVTDIGNPIVMKKDTIEYNASSFKTTDNDMLEDLLKKLPGVEVSEDGTVTANGETITKIMIDGETFFLDDPQLATKNIPAKIVEKVKVVEKKSEQAQFTGIDDGNEEHVIDLSIQKGMMNGMFGNLMGGVGHDVRDSGEDGDYRYQGAAFVGRFSDSNQLSVIVNGNNTNNRGFNDLSGGMMQGMRGGGGGMGRGQGGFGGGNGITTSWMGGVNGNGKFFDKKMDLGGNYLYNTSKREVEEESLRTTYLDDYDLVQWTKGFNNTNSDGHRFGIRMDHKFSDNTSILFEPQFNFGSGDYQEFSQTSTDVDSSSGLTRTNEGFSNNTGNNRNLRASGFLLLRQRLGAPGRTASFNLRYSLSNNTMDGLNQSLLTTFDDEGAASDSVTNQRYRQTQRSRSLTGRFTYTEPLGKGFFVEANYQLSWSKNTSGKTTWDSGSNTSFSMDNPVYVPSGETVNDVYSNSVLNRYINQEAGANFVYQKDRTRAQIGFAAIPTNTHNETNGKSYENKVVNWSPRAMVFWDLSENVNFRVFYNGRSSQPSTSQLMAVPDNTDPLRVSFGNPYLTPYFSHSVRSEFRYTNKETFTSINANVGFSMVQDPIVNATWYDLSGVQFSMPVNGHNSGSGNFRLFVNSPIAKSKFSIFSMTNGNYSRSSSYLGSKFDVDPYYSDGEFDYELFHKNYENLDDASEFALITTRTMSAMQRLRFTYRSDLVELTLGGMTRMNRSSVTNSEKVTMTWSSSVDASMNWTFPAGFGFVADGRYIWYNGYTSQQDDQLVINAQITKLAFANKVTFAVKAWDILAQSKNLTVTDSSLYHTEARNNTLGRYVILSVTYRFGNFGGQRGRGPGGPGRGPGGPGGPPPRF